MDSYADAVQGAKQQTASHSPPPTGPLPHPVFPMPTRRWIRKAYMQRDSVPDPIDCVYAWQSALSADAWGPDPALVRQIIDHVPTERIIAAFERDPRLFTKSDETRRKQRGAILAIPTGSDGGEFEPRSATPIATLYGLCVRVLVPFAVADAMLQARLPMLSGVVHFSRKHTPCGVRARVVRAPSDGLPCQQRIYGDAWWVSCCGCDKRHINPCTTSCPRGWFRRVRERDALRIMAWHWGDQVHVRRRSKPVRPKTKTGYCAGLYEREWMTVIGKRGWHALAQQANDPRGAVKIECCCTIMQFPSTAGGCKAVCAQTASMAKVHHPWDSRIDVAHRTDNGGNISEWHIVAAVEGDDLFVIETCP